MLPILFSFLLFCSLQFCCNIIWYNAPLGFMKIVILGPKKKMRLEHNKSNWPLKKLYSYISVILFFKLNMNIRKYPILYKWMLTPTKLVIVEMMTYFNNMFNSVFKMVKNFKLKILAYISKLQDIVSAF